MHPCLEACRCRFCLIWFFMSHQQSFSYEGTGLPGLKEPAQGHNTVTLVRLAPAAPRSWVKHFNTEPLHSPVGAVITPILIIGSTVWPQ